MSENQIPPFFDEVWDNWCSGKGPCFECPNRDSQCRFYPKFGEGVLNGEFAFVAETPNEAGRKNQNSSESRRERNGEFKSEIRNNPVPTWIKKGNRFSDSFFEDISADFSGDKENGIYYTNIKKCGDIKSERSEWKNKKAKLHCEQYLRKELQAVSPEIIVTFGEKATESFFETFESDVKFNNLKDIVLKVHHINSYKVIPSFHWSYLHLNVRSLDNIDNKQDYWTALAQEINSI